MKKIWLYYSIFLAIILLTVATGCKKSSDSNGAPELPPAISIDMDGLSSFTSLKKSTSVSSDSSNFILACSIVHTWDSISIKFVTTPKLIFKEALNGQSAVYDSETQQWTWTYIKTISGDGSFQAILTGKVDSDSVDWTMTVSRINGDGLNNFNWLVGRTDSKQTGGWWTLYEPVSKKACLLINWKKESEQVRWLQYTYITENACNKDCYIKYGTTNDAGYNKFFNIFSTNSCEAAKIEWNATSMAGRLIYLGNTYEWNLNENNKTISQ